MNFRRDYLPFINQGTEKQNLSLHLVFVCLIVVSCFNSALSQIIINSSMRGTPEETRVAQLKDRDPMVRSNAAEQLGKVRYADSVDALISVLAHDDVWRVRKSAAWALGEIKDPKAVVPLIRALGHRDWIIRLKSAEALGKIGDNLAVPALMDSLPDENDHVTGQIMRALGATGSTRAVEILLHYLDHEIPDVRMSAVSALGKIGDRRAVESLIRVLRDDRAAGVRKSSARALGGILDERSIGPLIEAFEDADYSVRLSAQLALEKTGSAAVPALITSLKSSRHTVQARAAWTLEEITGQRFGRNAAIWETWLSEQERGPAVENGAYRANTAD